MRIGISSALGFWIGCSNTTPSPTQSSQSREVDWAIRNMGDLTTMEPTTSTTTLTTSLTNSEQGEISLISTEESTTGEGHSTLQQTAVALENNTPVASSPSPTITIVNLADRPISFIRKSYQIYIREEIIADKSRSVLEKFNAFGIPALIDRFLDSPTVENLILRDMILLVAGELLAGADNADDTIDVVRGAVTPVCGRMNEVVSFSRDRNVADVISNKFRYVLENYPLGNFDFACPNRMSEDLEIAYAVIVQKIYREAILGIQPEGGAATWTISKLDNLSEEALLSAGLNFMSLVRPERLRRGFVLPPSGTLSIREWFDRYIVAIFGDKTNVQKDDDFFPQLGGRVSPSKFKAVGKFLALAFLELEPIGVSFSDDILRMLMGKMDPESEPQRSLCRGFHSVIVFGKLKYLGSEDLGAIFLGRTPTAYDTVIYLPSEPNVRQHLTPQRPDIVEWAVRASGRRGIALGEFGPLFEMFITGHDGEGIVVSPGGHIAVPQRLVDQLVAE